MALILRCLGTGLLLMAASGCDSGSPCEKLQKQYEKLADKRIKEAFEGIDPARKADFLVAVDNERALVKKNFVTVCKALPKDVDTACLVSDDNKGCKDIADRFFDQVYED